MNNILKALVENVDNVYKQVVNFGRGMETIWKSQMKMLEIKIVTWVEYVWGRICRLDTAKERINKPEDGSTEIIQT